MADIVLCGAGKQSLSSVVSGRALAQGRDPFATQHQRSGTSSAWSVHTAACCFCCCCSRRHRHREPTNDHHIVIAISSVACSLYEIVQEEANTNGPHEQATRARSLSRASTRSAAINTSALSMLSDYSHYPAPRATTSRAATRIRTVIRWRDGPEQAPATVVVVVWCFGWLIFWYCVRLCWVQETDQQRCHKYASQKRLLAPASHRAK